MSRDRSSKDVVLLIRIHHVLSIDMVFLSDFSSHLLFDNDGLVSALFLAEVDDNQNGYDKKHTNADGWNHDHKDTAILLRLFCLSDV